MGALITPTFIIMLIPLIILQVALAIFCIIKISKEGVENLSPVIWIIIVVGLNLTGSLAFLVIGRKKYDYNQKFDEKL